MNMPRIILSSASPRRRALLESLGWEFEISSPKIDETPFEGESPEHLCIRLSIEKAERAKSDGALVIAADTLVVLDGKILGKPNDEAHALEMLRSLNGKKHEVFTGLSVLSEKKSLSEVEMTTVFFRKMSEEAIKSYIATGEPMDKAGSYAIQGFGSFIVDKIDGDYFNVVGLPMQLLSKMLNEFGFSLERQFRFRSKS